MQPRGQDLKQRYMAAAHALQSAIAFDTTRQIEDLLGSGKVLREVMAHLRKHLRVGIDSAMASQAGLALLLMDKGVFTQAEYDRWMTEAMEREAERAAQEVRQRYALPDTVSFM